MYAREENPFGETLEDIPLVRVLLCDHVLHPAPAFVLVSIRLATILPNCLDFLLLSRPVHVSYIYPHT